MARNVQLGGISQGHRNFPVSVSKSQNESGKFKEVDSITSKAI